MKDRIAITLLVGLALLIDGKRYSGVTVCPGVSIHNGPGCLDPDRKVIYFTADQDPDRTDGHYELTETVAIPADQLGPVGATDRDCEDLLTIARVWVPNPETEAA